MYPPAKDHPGQVRAARTGLFQALADNARAAEWETIRPEDDGRLFYQKKTWQKLIIMAGGPTMNLLLAFVILLGVTATYGVYRSQLTVEPGAGVHRPRRRDRPELHRQAADAGVPVRASSPATDRRVQRHADRLLGARCPRRSGQPGRPGPDHRRARRPDRRSCKPVNTVITGVPDRWDPAKRVAAGFFGVEPVVERERGGPLVVLSDMGEMTAADRAGACRLPGQGLLHRLQPDHREAARHLRADEHRRRQPGGR